METIRGKFTKKQPTKPAWYYGKSKFSGDTSIVEVVDENGELRVRVAVDESETGASSKTRPLDYFDEWFSEPVSMPSEDELVVPLVHLNGTGKDELVEQITHAVHGAQAFLDALAKMSPHGRDYYPLGDDALPKAVDQHRSRMARVESIVDELGDLYLKVDDQER